MLAAAINRDRKAAIWHFLCARTFTVVSDKILSCVFSLNFDKKSANFILKWALSYKNLLKNMKKGPVLCYCGVSPLCIRGIWFHRFVYIAVTLKSVPSSIVLVRVFPSGGGGEPSSHIRTQTWSHTIS